MTHDADSYSDLELARALSGGHLSAFEELYQRHHRKVYGLCLRMLGNVPDAEDVTQEVFLQLYRKVGTFKGTATLSTWLHRMTVNAVLMYLRTKRRRHRERPADVQELRQTTAMSQPRSAGSPVTRIDLERAISLLPPGYKAVFLLHYVEGYAHEEIAHQLGVAVGTTKSQLHKARLRLRQLLEPKRQIIGCLVTQDPPAGEPLKLTGRIAAPVVVRVQPQ